MDVGGIHAFFASLLHHNGKCLRETDTIKTTRHVELHKLLSPTMVVHPKISFVTHTHTHTADTSFAIRFLKLHHSSTTSGHKAWP